MGASGTGAVIWVGLNPDPCKAKYLAKCGIETGPKPRPPSSPGTAAENRDQPARLATPMRPRSTPNGGAIDQYDPAFRQAMEDGGEHYDAWLQASRSGYLDTEEQTRPGTPARPPSRAATPARPPSRAATPARAVSVPPGGRRAKARREPRDLSAKSCTLHYLEQKMKLPGVLPPETFTSLGAWPTRGASKPDNIDELLYSGVSKSQEGRHAYLKARALLAPQTKNTTPATSSQEVAWDVHRGKPSMCLYPVRGHAAKCACPC